MYLELPVLPARPWHRRRLQTSFTTRRTSPFWQARQLQRPKSRGEGLGHPPDAFAGVATGGRNPSFATKRTTWLHGAITPQPGPGSSYNGNALADQYALTRTGRLLEPRRGRRFFGISGRRPSRRARARRPRRGRDIARYVIVSVPKPQSCTLRRQPRPTLQ
jgi:hypothetical protein